MSPFHQYHISVRVKTQSFLGTPEVKVLVPTGALNYNFLGASQTQDWQTHHEIHNSWQLGLRQVGGGWQLEMPTLSNYTYTVLRSRDLANWGPWTNFTAGAAVSRCVDANASGPTASFYRAQTAP